MALALLTATAARADESVTALVGGTIVDVSHRGASTDDIANATILLRGTRIEAAGPSGAVAVPPGATTVHIDGKYVVPGLVDGFTGMKTQAEANALLYEGVTTIGATGDDRRGTIFLAADPSPNVYAIDSVGSTDDWSLLRGDPNWRDRLADGSQAAELDPDVTRAQLAEIAHRGTRAVWVGHNISTANALAIIRDAAAKHVVTYGEFVATPYRAAIEAGVTVLVHTTRLELGLAPEPLLELAAHDPDGRGASAAYLALDQIDPADLSVARYGDLIAAHHVALMPTFSLFYAVLPGHRNLWTEKAASILDAKTMLFTTDPATGELHFPSSKVAASMQAYAAHSFALDRALIARGAPVLAASGAPWQGTLPGISMHTELEMLVRAGLSPRAALAAATGNYAEIFGWAELGAVAAGRRADLLVLDADPARDTANVDRIDSVYLAGEKLDRDALLRKPAQ